MTQPRAAASPPEGGPWDLPIDETPFAFVDLEMTGLDPKKDEIVELCIERTIGDRLERRLETLVRPKVLAGPGMAIHGLTAEELANAPPFEAIATEVASILEGAVFVAHGARWDVRFLSSAFSGANRECHIAHWIDTIHLTRRAFVLESHSLTNLRAHFNIDSGPAHRAGSDVAALREVFRRTLLALAPKTARDLFEVRVGVGQARTEILDACAAFIASGAPAKVVYRPSRRAAETQRLILTALNPHDGTATILGYNVESRGRVELRAERILSVETDDGAHDSRGKEKLLPR